MDGASDQKWEGNTLFYKEARRMGRILNSFQREKQGKWLKTGDLGAGYRQDSQHNHGLLPKWFVFWFVCCCWVLGFGFRGFFLPYRGSHYIAQAVLELLWA